MEQLDPIACYRALETRDARFDGRIFVGVTSTGIYCRPVCPARTAKFGNCRWFRSAAAAQEAGFRPCLRCRPETAPDAGAWRGTSNTVARGLALIAEGALDGDEAGVDQLAERLGVGGRQLRRLFKQHLGASPITVAQTRRVLFAKQLIHDTRMPMTEIALAAGFGSVRRFNESFQELFRRPPSALRRKAVSSLPEGSVAASGVDLRLRYRPPYDWPTLLAFLRSRAIDGVEQVDGDCYRRTVQHDGALGSIEIRHLAARESLVATIRFPNVGALPAIVAGIRRVFDLGADVATIGAHLAQDPLLAPLVAERPGLRAPGAWSEFERAIRAQANQEGLLSRLVRLCAVEVPAEQRIDPGLLFGFPTAAQVLAADLSSLGMPDAGQMIRAAQRAASTADVFSPGDIGLLDDPAERWRPWRAYAVQHLWAAGPAYLEGVPQ